ncbi:unnamed protein product [Heligmosomoides polygyrus]|uniref:Endo/exonuclease/phosphatase domain-containing protein n=1 Tax=Heligmosomoides polygyrus TaxID=6339 RepID=A0A183G6I6_HELPZ|nr:unnamed protein product [Heligmosomoides polygyrus]
MARSCELAEALERRGIDLCAVQEMRWSCCKSRDIGRGFKAILCGSPRTTGSVGVIISKRLRDAVVSVERSNDRLMKVVVAAEQRICHFFSAYAPQSGCSERAKDKFWILLDEKTAETRITSLSRTPYLESMNPILCLSITEYQDTNRLHPCEASRSKAGHRCEGGAIRGCRRKAPSADMHLS